MPAIALTETPDDLARVINAICEVGVRMSQRIANGQVGDDGAAATGTNADGDDQKPLDVIADRDFAAALKGLGVRYYASEERAEVEKIDGAGQFFVAIDPLDGSSNIDVNVSIGTIFSIRAEDEHEEAEAPFLSSNQRQIASGYIIYGPQTSLVITFGAGTRLYTLNPESGQFCYVRDLSIPEVSQEFAINASNYRHWSKPVQSFVDDCLSGTDGPRGQNFNMRWVASLVAEAHRILTRGGIFLYPDDARPGYERGRLRMLYECAPIAFLIEQAGGRAIDGRSEIMGLNADRLHARSPLIFGSAKTVDTFLAHQHDGVRETSALFGDRGLFRK